jgi:hypothetical protein
MAGSNIQKDMHDGQHRRGTIPASVHFETEEERIAELTAKRDALPPGSTARQIICDCLLRDYDITSA